MKPDFRAPGERWRTVLLTNIPGGITYPIFENALRPLGHRIVGVVTTPGPRQRRSMDYLDVVAAVPPAVDVIVSSHPQRLAALLAPLRPDLVISAGFPWLIPADVIDLPRIGAINLHPSLLPRHRGPYPIEWALRCGDAMTGFTMHELHADFDTGPILGRRSIPIDDEDDGASLLHALLQLIPGVIHESLARIARGEAGEPQDNTNATYAGKFENESRKIDWSQPARTIHNRVRSWTGYRDVAKGALGEVDLTPLIITRTRLIAADHASAAAPGTLLRRMNDRMVVQCGDGPLEIVSWNRESRDRSTGAFRDAAHAIAAK